MRCSECHQHPQWCPSHFMKHIKGCSTSSTTLHPLRSAPSSLPSHPGGGFPEPRTPAHRATAGHGFPWLMPGWGLTADSRPGTHTARGEPCSSPHHPMDQPVAMDQGTTLNPAQAAPQSTPHKSPPSPPSSWRTRTVLVASITPVPGQLCHAASLQSSPPGSEGQPR